MSSQLIWEIIGYIGSAIVLVSLLMSSVIRLRILNLIGSLVFAVYAFAIHSYPTALMNLALVGIDLYFLYKYIMQKRRRVFTAVRVSARDSAAEMMLRSYGKDMQVYFGRVDLSRADVLLAVYDGDVLAGLTAGHADGSSLELILDYTTPQYRDCSVGCFVLETLAPDYQQVSFRNPCEKHVPYLLRMGYQPKENGQCYVKAL